MSDARLFCTVLFFAIGLGAAAQNHGLWRAAPGEAVSSVVLLGLVLACFAIMLFGKSA